MLDGRAPDLAGVVVQVHGARVRRAISLCLSILLCLIVVWRVVWWNQREYTKDKGKDLAGGMVQVYGARVLLVAARAPAPRVVPRVRSHCRLRNRGTEYASQSGMKWMRGGAE